MLGWTFCDVRQSRAEQARKGPKKTKDLSFSACIFLSPFFGKFLLCQVADTFCEVQNRAEQAGGKCKGGVQIIKMEI